MSTQTEPPPGSLATASQDAFPSLRNFAILIITSLYSSSGPTWDLLRFLIIGGIAELFRRFFMFVWNKLENQFWITATIDEWDHSYCEFHLPLCHLSTSFTDNRIDWLMLWLSKRPEWTRAKELSISTHSFGVGDIAALVEGEEDGNSQNKIRFLPSHDRTASLWYRGHYIRLSRSRISEGIFMKQVLTIK